MDLEDMYENFRHQYPALAAVADARHSEAFGTFEDGTIFLWFESLAHALNAEMRSSKEDIKLNAVFGYFDVAFRTGNQEVRNCIDVSLVENLFWGVSPKLAVPAWASLPRSLKQLFTDFHGRSPKLD